MSQHDEVRCADSEDPSSEEDDYNDDEDNEQAIYEAITACLELFSRLIGQADSSDTSARSEEIVDDHPPERAEFIKDMERSFNLWIDYTGALAADVGRSLDVRVQRYTDIKGMSIELLEMLARNLEYLEKTERRGSNSPIASELQNEAVKYIQHAVEELHFIARVIRRSSIRSQHYSFSSVFERDDDTYFENYAFIIVRHTFPNARRSLCKQLSVSTALRRKHLRHKIQHEEKLKTRRTPGQLNTNPAQEIPIAQSQPSRPQPGLSPMSSSSPRQVEGPVHSTRSIDTRSNLNAGMARRGLKARPVLSTISMGSSVRLSERKYPPKPHFQPGATDCACPYCSRRLDTVKLSRNPTFWDDHLDEDVQPYICLSEECTSPLLFFAHMKQWVDHMNSMHSEQWTRRIHMSTWFCETDHEAEQFNDLESFIQHMKDPANHDRKPPSDLQLDTLSRTKQKVLTREDEYSCPFCDCIPDTLKPVIPTSEPKAIRHQLHKHIASHIKDLAVLSVPILTTTETAESESNESKDGEKGRRLKEGEEASYPSGDDDELRAVTLSDIENPGEMPPLDIDETQDTHWHDVGFIEWYESEKARDNTLGPKMDVVLQDFIRVQDGGGANLEEHRDVEKKHLQTQKDIADKWLHVEEEECYQLFLLTADSKDPTFEWYKDRVEDRIEGTCIWFLRHEHFQTWLSQESGPLLVSADPGCGKSVLAKYLIDHGLPRSTTICYFFFDEQYQNTVQQALCALLHQLFSQKPRLIEHALERFDEYGQSLIDSTERLWEILRKAIKDPQAGSVIMVLDALDECAESEFADLMRNVESQFRGDHLGRGKLKYILTCRPYDHIMSEFRDLLKAFPNIHIPREEESETISQEVNHVITYRVNRLSERKRLTLEIQSQLEKRLQETTHRTYLWVYLVFDYLEKADFRTPEAVESTLKTLPRSINEAYEQILNETKEDPKVRKVLSIILAAGRPLTISEMNVAVKIDYTSQSIDDLDLEDDWDIKKRLESWCGLFVSIYHGIIYFHHPTAHKFLLAGLASPATGSSELRWYHSFTTRDADAVLAKVCVLYLNTFNSSTSTRTSANREAGHSASNHAFLDYSAKYWGAHFRKASIMDDEAIVPLALRVCDPESKSYSAWFRLYWEATNMETTDNFTDLMVGSFYGHRAVVKLLLAKRADIEARDSYYGRTPLLWAAYSGHEAVVKLLLENGADIEAKGTEGMTPLLLAAGSGFEAAVKLLLEKGADIESKDSKYGFTPLLWAVENGREAVVKLLLEKGADIESKESEFGRTPLSWAAENGYEDIVKLLLAKGADTKTKDKEGLTPLFWAARWGRGAVFRLLQRES